MTASIVKQPSRVSAWGEVGAPDHYHRTRPHPYCPVCKEPVLGHCVYVEEDGRNNYYHVDCHQGELCPRCLHHGDFEPLTREHLQTAHAA